MRYALLPDPWETPDRRSIVCCGGRPCLAVQKSGVNVTCGATSESLPCTCRWSDGAEEEWAVFELPATSVIRKRGTVGEVAEELQLTLRGADYSWERLVLRQEGGIPRPGRSEDLDAPEDEQDVYDACSAMVAELVDSHVDLINRLADMGDSESTFEWEGEARGVVFRPLEKVLREWQKAEGRDEPRMALIVKLARELKDFLPDVCRRPRVVLSRQRQLHDVARIQEIDSACLRWIGKQPGLTVAEKAGPRQRLLGVVRVEFADTLENRVVRDLIIRALDACSRYLFEHMRYPDHNRVKLVRNFRHLLGKLLKDTPISQANPLVGVPSPNYVLLHDRRYSILWKAYVKLVRQEKQQDAAWRWQRRVWAEHCLLGCLASLWNITGLDIDARADVLLKPEQEWGRFIGTETCVASWSLDNKGRHEFLDVVDCRCVERHPAIPCELLRLSPDAVYVRRSPALDTQPYCILATWTVLDFDVGEDGLRGRTETLSHEIEALQLPFPTSGLIIQPDLPGMSKGSTEVEVGCCRGARLHPRLQQHIGEIARIIRTELGIG